MLLIERIFTSNVQALLMGDSNTCLFTMTRTSPSSSKRSTCWLDTRRTMPSHQSFNVLTGTRGFPRKFVLREDQSGVVMESIRNILCISTTFTRGWYLRRFFDDLINGPFVFSQRLIDKVFNSPDFIDNSHPQNHPYKTPSPDRW